MRRLPLIPTLVVGLAIAAMIALGVWQLDRARWKTNLLAQYEQAGRRPPITFPALDGDESHLFRRSSAYCLQVVGWRVEAGRNRQGVSGWRHLAACRTGAEGPGVTLDMGWTADFGVRTPWSGGHVTGTIASAPVHASLIATLTARPGPLALMIVADRPAPGFAAPAAPAIADVPNNHFGYAVQWFLFAGVAAIIYALALRRRREGATKRP
ncbi:MAG: SURF1 family protein [Sphingomonas sp.]